MIVNTFTYPDKLQVLLVDNFFPDDLIEELLTMCDTSETHAQDWQYADWTNLRKIHKGNTDTFKKLESVLRDRRFLQPMQVYLQEHGKGPLKMEFVQCNLWADYPGFGPLLAHQENAGQAQGQIFLTRELHKTNGTSMLNNNKELLFTLPYRNNYGWVMQDCQKTMHSREFDVVPNTVRYSLIFWHNYIDQEHL